MAVTLAAVKVIVKAVAKATLLETKMVAVLVIEMVAG